MKYTPLLVTLYTVVALLCFAANSVLCRLALGSGAIDAVSFTIIRLISGAVILGILVLICQPERRGGFGGSWSAALMLFLYAAAFSLAYLKLDTGVGALILFGAVQISIVFVGIYGGDRLSTVNVCGLLIAFAGLAYLVWPEQGQATAHSSYTGIALMTLSGIAWGAYTLSGRGSITPLRDTAYNFIRSVPFCVLLLPLIAYRSPTLSGEGILLSIVAGAITSGLGYAVWYLALQGLTRFQSAGVQLSVPVLAAVGGVLFVNEALTLKLVISLMVILGGIALIICSPDK